MTTGPIQHDLALATMESTLRLLRLASSPVESTL